MAVGSVLFACFLLLFLFKSISYIIFTLNEGISSFFLMQTAGQVIFQIVFISIICYYQSCLVNRYSLMPMDIIDGLTTP